MVISLRGKEVKMLVLGRKLDERILIGDDIVITVVYLDRWKVRLGIEAPRDTPVWREELVLDRKAKEVANRATDTENVTPAERTAVPPQAPGQQGSA